MSSSAICRELARTQRNNTLTLFTKITQNAYHRGQNTNNLIHMASQRKGIGSHQSARMKKSEWLTPPEIIHALGQFDLDPCSPIDRPWDTAINHLTIEDDGLNSEWKGRVWCNPPYGLEASLWLEKLSIHQNGIALVFARTETQMFFKWVWSKAKGILFIEGRLYFYHSDGTRANSNSGAPSCLIAYDDLNASILKDCNISGKFFHICNS